MKFWTCPHTDCPTVVENKTARVVALRAAHHARETHGQELKSPTIASTERAKHVYPKDRATAFRVDRADIARRTNIAIDGIFGAGGWMPG